MDLKIGYFQPITKPASLFVESEGGTTFGVTSTGVPQFSSAARAPQRLWPKRVSGISIIYFVRIHARPAYASAVSREKVYAVGAYEIGKMYGVPPAASFPPMLL